MKPIDLKGEDEDKKRTKQTHQTEDRPTSNGFGMGENSTGIRKLRRGQLWGSSVRLEKGGGERNGLITLGGQK